MDVSGEVRVRQAEGDTIRAYRVTGRVQGVGFRWWTRAQAEALGLRGTVRNCADGSVEVVAGGAADALERLRSALAHGPPGARVDDVAERPVADPDLPAGFEIVR
ncbi:MAG TPA: acylphosphatase [Longimicrobiales bacterium]